MIAYAPEPSKLTRIWRNILKRTYSSWLREYNRVTGFDFIGEALAGEMTIAFYGEKHR